MMIKVLFFAQLKDFFGTSERCVEVEEGTAVSELVCTLFSEPRAACLKGLPIFYSVNEAFIETNRELKDKDTLALLPPMAGG